MAPQMAEAWTPGVDSSLQPPAEQDTLQPAAHQDTLQATAHQDTLQGRQDGRAGRTHSKNTLQYTCLQL